MTQQQFIDEFTSLPDEAKRQVVDFIAFLGQRYKATQPPVQSHATDLENEPFIGM